MKRNRTHTVAMFPAGDDLPLFSGTCQRVEASPYQPAERAGEQERLLGVETRPAMKQGGQFAISPEEWSNIWEPINPRSPGNRCLSASAYAAKVSEHWRGQSQIFSNARYEVYLEALLASGQTVPQAYLNHVSPDALQFHDCPLVEAARHE